MRIGIPKERKAQEFRVGGTPATVRELTVRGHAVYVERGAGEGSAIPDADFAAAGAVLVDQEEVWGEADLVWKVKEPLPEEYGLLRVGQLLFTYLHLAASLQCTQALLDAGVVAIAYETVQTVDGTLPLLAPMSEVAGRMAPQVGAHTLERLAGGKGILLGGVPGVAPAKVVVLGGGVAGTSAVKIAVGMQADVTLIDTDIRRLRHADVRYGGRVRTLASSAATIEAACLEADLVIGAVLVPGARAPKLVNDELVAAMKSGSVLVDVAVDQGGCFESTHPTTHQDPTYEVAGSLFYAVANMPGAVPHTSTYALANVTLPYLLAIATKGWERAVRDDEALARGVNTVKGVLTSVPVAEAHELPMRKLGELSAT